MIPAFKLNGKEVVYLEYIKNSTSVYLDPGVVAISSNGEAITNITSVIKDINDRVVLAISYGQEGIYHIYYDAEYNNQKVRIIRTVIVRDSKAPVITFPTTTTKVSRSNAASYNLTGDIVCSDESDCDVVVDRTLPSTIGTYTITYTATDRSKRKNTSTFRRTIIVQ